MGDPSDGAETMNSEELKEINDVDDETVKEGLVAKAEIKSVSGEDASKLDDSSELEALKSEEPEMDESEGEVEKESISTEMIEKAVKRRAKYIKDESDKLTLAGLRRLLEEDLGLEEKSLDSFKTFIRDQVDEVIDPKKPTKPSPSVKKVAKKAGKGKVSKKAKSEESFSSAHSGSEEEAKPKRKRDSKKVTDELKKRKKPRKAPATKVKAKENPKDDDGSENNGNSSEEDDESRSSAEKEKPATKKATSTPVYGKRVEHLKSVIKSCGMSVPPVLYKKVNQEPEDKRESRLIKELQEILSKEGLSANPSEKEVKDVRKKKERAKELEGIDVSNVLSSSRRRSTTSYVAPPKPKIPIDSDAESSEEEDDEEDEEDDEENNDGSQSDASNVDDEVNSD